MTNHRVRIGVGTRLIYDGEPVELIELMATVSGNEVVLKSIANQCVRRVALREILSSARAQIIPDYAVTGDEMPDTASAILTRLTEADRQKVAERSEDVREVLTGYRLGIPGLALLGEPRAEYHPALPLFSRYAAKAAELGMCVRTIQRWVRSYQRNGEAGLALSRATQTLPAHGHVDTRWIETALEVMVEHTDMSKPSRTTVIERAHARVTARYGENVVALPSRATAFRVLRELETRHPTFRLSTKRNRDIARRPNTPYGKLRPTRPGEYLLMDTTRLDVFALDPLTLRWVQAELTVGMDWYTRCITGIRLTPVSTKSMDVAAVLYPGIPSAARPERMAQHSGVA